MCIVETRGERKAPEQEIFTKTSKKIQTGETDLPRLRKA